MPRLLCVWLAQQGRGFCNQHLPLNQPGVCIVGMWLVEAWSTDQSERSFITGNTISLVGAPRFIQSINCTPGWISWKICEIWKLSCCWYDSMASLRHRHASCSCFTRIFFCLICFYIVRASYVVNLAWSRIVYRCCRCLQRACAWHSVHLAWPRLLLLSLQRVNDMLCIWRGSSRVLLLLSQRTHDIHPGYARFCW